VSRLSPRFVLAALLAVILFSVPLVAQATASELVLEPILKIRIFNDTVVSDSNHPHPYLPSKSEGCGNANGEVGEFIVELIPAAAKCWQVDNGNTYAQLLDGWLPEKTSIDQLLLVDRPVVLYQGGKVVERSELGNFQAAGAHFSRVYTPGTYELVVPSSTIKEKVFRAKGPPQDEAKSYWAKIILPKVTYQLTVR
jgi:hypothetical protein